MPKNATPPAARLFLALTFLAALSAAACPALAEQRVCIINSYSRDFVWTRDLDDALRRGLPGVDIVTFDMDTKALPQEVFAQRAELALAACDAAAPDLVVLSDDNALRLLGQRLVDQGRRVLFMGINNNPRAYLDDPRKATGVLERPLYKRSVLLARRLLGPTARRGLVLFDDSPTARVLHEEIFAASPQYVVGDTVMDFLATNSLEQWRLALTTARQDGYSFIALGLRHTLRDAQGGYVNPDDATAWARDNASVPLFGFWDFDIGPGKTLGGVVLTGSTHGEIAAVLARRLLNGDPPEEVPAIHDRQGVLMFSLSELKRHGITLPEDLRQQADLRP